MTSTAGAQSVVQSVVGFIPHHANVFSQPVSFTPHRTKMAYRTHHHPPALPPRSQQMAEHGLQPTNTYTSATNTYSSAQPVINKNDGIVAATGHDDRHKSAWIHHVPSFREWIGDSWVDLVAVIGAAILAGALNLLKIANHRQFPIAFRDGTIVYPEFSYPRRTSIVPIWLDALLAILIPTLFFVIAQIRVKSFYDLNVAFWGNIWAIITATLFQVFLKVLIGGFRPHFLTICDPDIVALQAQGLGTGYQNIMFDRSICRADPESSQFRDSMKSFPSGHTACAVAGFGYLALYFNAKMKTFSDERPHFYKMLVFFAPLLGATLVGCALTVDNSHHWYDVVVGAIIGAACCLAAFRMSFASIWDHRFNHIPLPRSSSAWNPFVSSRSGSSGAATDAPGKFGRFQYALDPASNFRSWAHGENEGAWELRGAPGDALQVHTTPSGGSSITHLNAHSNGYHA